MTRPKAKSISLTKLSKAVRIPRHPLSTRLRKVLEVIDEIHTASNLKPVAVVMNSLVLGGVFDAHTGTGPYTIYLDPDGSHPELSLLHEVGHYVEWQAIPKAALGPRDFKKDALFSQWFYAVGASKNIGWLFGLRDDEIEGSSVYQMINYLLDAQELWARSYSQYVAAKKQVPVLLQQIASENKVVTGNIQLKPYWSIYDFLSIQIAINEIFQTSSWLK